MIKTVTLYLFLMVSGGQPTMIQQTVPDLDECVKQGIIYMVTESKELNNSGLPYKQAFLCEESFLPSN